MKFIRLDLLTLLISLFILNSCKNQDSIGLGIITSNQLSGNLIDTSTIVINTISEDTIMTSGLSQTPLGYFKDPVFGTTQSNLVMDLNLPGTISGSAGSFTVPFGTNVIDSAVLVMRYAQNNFFGDSIASKYKANVYQLQERLLSGTTYYSNKTWKADTTTVLGTKSFFSRTADSISVVNPIAGAPDTAVKVAPQLRIPISTDFINRILFYAPPAQLSSNLLFKNTVNGLYVKLDKTQPGPGGTFMMALDSSSSIEIHYRNTNGTVVDTNVITLPIILHAAEIRHVHSATINAALAANKTNSKLAYLEGLGGLRNRISFPYLKNIIKSVGSDVVINRAELVITAQPGSTIPFAPLPKLGIYRWDLAHQIQLVQDQAQGDPRYFDAATTAGFYITQEQNYHFLITGYVQDLMRGITTDYGTFIGTVVPTANVAVTPTAQVDGRTVVVGYDTSSPYRIKLNLYYTKVTR
ncbi:DUF4270 family protein [Mucilaginibacter sp. dw_454]|uniref:DUF4270 family protein n=1 Tax=Mucilaginibacter sp. dw_454 TaxID=2720079 RepID=UPI001BD2FEAD|nr:DUF4270 family protein [Mucilaginibacter sp. dw_454]